MSSFSAPRSGRGDDGEAPHGGIRNIPPGEIYDAGDGYILPNPQLFPNQRSSGYGSGGGASARSGDTRARRRGPTFQDNRNIDEDDESDTASDDDGWNSDDGRGQRYRGDRGRRVPHTIHRRSVRKEYGPPIRGRSADDGRPSNRRSRDPFYYRDGPDGDSDDDRSPSPRGRRSSVSGMALIRRPSIAGIRQKVGDLMWDSDNEKTGNSELKKLGATMAGALAGGLAAQQAGKKYGRDHWVPTALGAFMGGFTAREAEKFWYKRKATKDEEKEDDSDDDGGYRNGRSQSHGR
jgi:hypothetical protein